MTNTIQLTSLDTYRETTTLRELGSSTVPDPDWREAVPGDHEVKWSKDLKTVEDCKLEVVATIYDEDGEADHQYGWVHQASRHRVEPGYRIIPSVTHVIPGQLMAKGTLIGPWAALLSLGNEPFTWAMGPGKGYLRGVHINRVQHFGDQSVAHFENAEVLDQLPTVDMSSEWAKATKACEAKQPPVPESAQTTPGAHTTTSMQDFVRPDLYVGGCFPSRCSVDARL